MRVWWLIVGVVVGCGGSTQAVPAEPVAQRAGPGLQAAPTASTTPATSASGGVALAASSAVPSGPPVASAGPVASAAPTTVLLDTKLPPKVISVGGSYSVAVAEPRGVERADAVSALDRGSKLVDGCLGDLFKVGGKRGKVAFALTLDERGKPRVVKNQLDELQDRKLLKCLEGAIRKIEWPMPPGKDAAFTVEWRIES